MSTRTVNTTTTATTSTTSATTTTPARPRPIPARSRAAGISVARQVQQQRRGYAAAVLAPWPALIGDDPPPRSTPRCAAASSRWVCAWPLPHCVNSPSTSRRAARSNCPDRDRPGSSGMAHATAREQVSMLCCGRRWVGVDRAPAVGAPAGAVMSLTTPRCGTGTAAADAASIRDHWT